MAEADPVNEPMGVQPARPKGSEAAAILLMLLGDEEAADVLSRLEPDDVQSLGSAMFGVADVSEEQVENVFDLFLDKAKARTTIGFGATPRIRAVMQHALGEERAAAMLARITPPARSRAFNALRWMDAKTIASLVVNEHPQIAALVLAHLDAAIAADVLQLLPAEMQSDVIYRVATLGEVTSEALDELERILADQATKPASSPAPFRGGASEAAKIMNNTRPGADQRIIKSLAKIDKRLAQTIEEEMFIFDNLMELDDKNLGILLRNVENDILVVALKGANEVLRDRMYGCMSQRAAQSVQDEIEERGPMRLTEVLDAQREMLAVARRLADAGTIIIAANGDDYV